MAELKSTISEQLRKFWRASEKELTDSPRRGIVSPAEATALREEVAAEIADLIKAQKVKTRRYRPRRRCRRYPPARRTHEATRDLRR